MNERIKNIQTQLLEFWNKYDKKRKAQIISVAAAVLVTLIILAVVVSQPQYEVLRECESDTEAADVSDILTSNEITFTTENNGLTIMVQDADLVNATYLIAQAGITAEGYSMEDYMDAVGFGTTTSDRERLYKQVLEDKMVTTLESFDYVKSAYVSFDLPETNYSVLDEQEDTYVAVKLNLSNSLPDGAAESMAQYIATAVGNDTTSRITIIDSEGKSLFVNNYDTDDTALSSSAIENIRNIYKNEIITNVTKMFAKVQLYNSVSVSPSLDVSFDKIDSVETLYSNPENVVSSDYIYEQEGGSTSGGIPGTDSNDTTYLIDTGDSTTTSISINKHEYAVSSTITHTEGEQGTYNNLTSSITVTLEKYVIYDEDLLNQQGALANTTWEQYKVDNGEVTPLTVDAQLIQAISDATRIPVDNITVLAYSVPVFNDYVSSTNFVTDILPIIIAVIILLLLGFVVWRSLRPVQIVEQEPELSVEELLTSTKEKQYVEDIDMEGKSEVRKAIEKFVDENPEAVALLMRNWLNEDWN